jgi:gliding motility-associated-like protein
MRVLVFSDSNPQANAGPDQSLCTTSGTITMAGSALIAPATGSWTLVSGTGTITDPGSPTTTVSGIGVGQSIFQWTVSNGPCDVVSTDQMSVFIYDPNNPAASAGADQSFCTPLTGTALEGSTVTFPATGVWSIVSGTGTFVDATDPGTTVNGLGLGTNQFAWTVNNGVCPNAVTTDVVQVELFNGNAQAADAGPDQGVCGTTIPVVLGANAPSGLATGTWSVVAGTGNFSSASAPNATVTGLSIGVNTLRWSIDNGACGITSDLVTILVYDPNNPLADAGADQELCTPTTSAALLGSPLTVPAVGVWTLVTGSGTIADPSNPATAVSGLAIGANVFRWQVNNGACADPITQDEVTIFLYEQDAPPANAGPDQELCTPVNTVQMAANSAVGSALGTWSLVSGGGNIANVNDPNTTISGLPVGINVFEWSISNGPCGTSTDQVRILVFDANNDEADAGPDQELCTPTASAVLAGSALTSPAAGQWTLVSGSGVIADPSSPSSTVSGLAVGENIFRWTVSNGPCSTGTTTDQVSIFLFDASNAIADAGSDQEFCTPVSSTTLSGSPVIPPATGSWQLVSGSGTIVSPGSPITEVTGMTVGENIFRYSVSNGPCANGQTVDEVSVFIFDGGNAVADAGPDQELCTPNTSTNLSGSAVIAPATGQWTLVSGGGTIADPASPSTLVSDMPVGENIFRWTVENGPCAEGISFDEVRIFVFDANNPIADAGADLQQCTPNTLTTLAGSALIFPATGTWTLVAGQGSITSPTSSTTTVIDLGVGENIFEWTVSNGPCSNGVTSDRVSIFIFDQNNTQVDAGNDQDLCSPVPSTFLQASPVIFPASGTWTLLSGSGTIVDVNSPTTEILNPGIGENVFEWSVVNGPCESGAGSDIVVIRVFDENNPVADAGPDQEHCSPNIFTVQLSGSPVTFPAIGTWSLVSGTGSIANANDPNTTVFDISIGESVFLWTVDNGPCATGITTDEVRVRIFDENNPDAAAGDDQSFCTPVSSAALNGSAVNFPATGTWTVVSGSGTVVEPALPNTSITALTPGVTVVEWTVSNGPCANGITTDQALITLFDAGNPVADAGVDQELCTPTGTATTSVLQGSNVIFPAVGTWTLVGGTGDIADPNDPNSAVTGLGIGENVFLWTVSNGVCDDPISTDLVSIFVFDENNADANAGPNQQICTPVTNAFMSGSPVILPAVGTWTLVSGQGTIVDPNDPETEITDLGIGINIFAWTVDNGACSNGVTSAEVILELFDTQAPPANAGPDQELCAPDNSAALVANPPVGSAQGSWSVVQGTGSVAVVSDPNTVITGLQVGETILTWTISGGECVTTVDSISIFVFDPNNVDAFAGLDQELCVPQDSAFMAGSSLIFPATGTWSLVSGAGAPVAPNDPATLISGLGTGVNVFQWEVYNGPCTNSPTSDQVTITLYSDSTSAANAGPDLETCLPVTTINLQGEQPIAPGVGTWTLLSGGGTIVDPTDPNTQVTGLPQGESIFVWTLEWDPCPNNGLLTDTMTVRVFDPFAPAANAGPDQELCTPQGSTTLAGNVPATPGVGTWTVVSGGAVVTAPNDANSTVTGLTVGVHVLVWTINNGDCGFGPPSNDTLQIRVYDGEAGLAQAGGDISLCTPQDNVALVANEPVFPAVGTWTPLTGTGTLVDANDPGTLVLGLGVGQHDFRWTIDNGACGSSSDDISIFLFDGASAAADAGDDVTLCLPGTEATLSGNGPVFPGTGSWEVVEGGAVLADAADPATAVSGLTIGPNTFRWTIVNGPCGTTSDEVTILLYSDQQAAANAGGDLQLCTPASTASLAANSIIFPATGAWTVVSGTASIADPADPATTVSGLGVGEVVLRWTIDNGPCGSGLTSDEVVIRVYDNNAAPATAGPDQSFCTPIDQPVTMFASGALAPATGTWSVVSGQGTLVNGDDPFSTVTGLALGSNVFRWTIDNGACGSTSDEVVLAVFDHTVPPADAGLDQEFCQDVSSTLLDAVPVSSTATGSWALIAGTGILSDASDAGSGVTGLQLGSNWFTWTVSNGPCPASVDSVMIFIRDCLTIDIPNAYSPNGDGVNDIFRITNIESYPGSSFQVFNRWGSKVLDQSPYANDWDGTSQFGSAFGEQLPESTYYYVLDLGDGSDAYTGYIYLRR